MKKQKIPFIPNATHALLGRKRLYLPWYHPDLLDVLRHITSAGICAITQNTYGTVTYALPILSSNPY